MSETLETVEAKLAALNAKRDELKEEARKLQAELDQIKAEEAATAKLASMSDTERAALSRVIQAGSIQSGEQFGKM